MLSGTILEPSIANNSFDSYQVVHEYLRLDNLSFSDPFQATAIGLWLVGHVSAEDEDSDYQ
jgi:hypothetical protein